MNAHIEIKQSLGEAHASAVEAANAWRGRCVNLFARAEWVVTTALIALLPEPKKPHMLISKKVDNLKILRISEPKLIEALDEFATLLPQRTALTHGCGSVYVRPSGWMLELIHCSRRGDEIATFDKDRMDKFRLRLHKSVQRLESMLK